MRHDWVVYAKTPLAGPEVVLDYLSRYTHRVAVSNERIVGIDAKGVRLRVRADDHGGKRTSLIDGQTFIARFLQQCCRRASSASVTTGCSARRSSPRMAQARAALAMPASNPGREDAAQFIKRVAGIDISCCPHCRLGQWRTVQLLPPAARRLGPPPAAFGEPLSPVGYTAVHRPVRCASPTAELVAAGPATMRRPHFRRTSMGHRP